MGQRMRTNFIRKVGVNSKMSEHFICLIQTENSFRMSLVSNVCVQILAFCEHLHDFLRSIRTSNPKQSATVRFCEKTITCPMKCCVFTAQTKNVARSQTFFSSQNLCKSPNEFSILHISCGKITEINSNSDISEFTILQSAQMNRKCSHAIAKFIRKIKEIKHSFLGIQSRSVHTSP